MDEIIFAFRSEESRPLPLPKECVPKNVLINIAQTHTVLTVYDEYLPGIGSHYASMSYKGSSLQKCISRPFERADEATRIYGLLIRCKHASILQPLGIWMCEPKLKLTKPKKDELTVDGDKVEEEKIFAAFITFPLIDGALMEVPREDIFLVEKDDDNVDIITASKKQKSYGLTCQGSSFFSDILGVVKYINGFYEHPVNTSSVASSSGSIGTPFPLCSLRFNPHRIVYNKLLEGEYKVLFWADFFTEEHERLKYNREPTVEDIRLANWGTVGAYLRSLWKTFDIEANEELKHLANMLSEPKGKEATMYTDLLWEPGLWPVYTKVHFIREVFWCFDGKEERQNILKSKGSLGLKTIIKKLGFSNADANLYDSIMFLRKKVVAHQDSSYESYRGTKNEVDTDKTTILIFIQKMNPTCMIQLAKEIHQLNWIKDSPLLRSETDYMKQFKSK